MKVTAVIPAWNEAPRIGAVLQAVLPHVQEVIVVDDGSQAGTQEVLRAHPVVSVSHVINRGQGAALRTGTHAAVSRGADIILHLDADGQHDPNVIPVLIQPILSGEADVVLGSRFLGVDPVGMPSTRRVLLKLARWFNWFVLGIPLSITDAQSGLRAFRREVAETLEFTQDQMAHASELLRLFTRSSWRVREVPIRVLYSDEVLKKGVKSRDAVGIVWQLFLGLWHR